VEPSKFIREVRNMEDMNDLEMMTVSDVAEYLNISTSTVRRLIRQTPNPMPHIKLGSTLRIPRSRLNVWIVENMED
jgi:excisionase family DNA binding protein